MPPESDGGGTRTVRCSFEKIIVDEQVKQDLRETIQRVHEAAIYASELLNIHIRLQIEQNGFCTHDAFDKNELAKVFQSVTAKPKSSTSSVGEPHSPHPKFKAAFDKMPEFTPVVNRGLTNVLQLLSTNMATVAINNVKMHFRRRMFHHVKLHHKLSKDAYNQLSKEERTAFKLQLLKICSDVCETDSTKFKSNTEHHEWIRVEKLRLGLDGNDICFSTTFMEKFPERFIKAMYIMSSEAEASGGRAFSLYPLRRNMVTKFIQLDQRSLNEVLQGMRNERMGRKRKAKEDEVFTFASVLNFRAAKVRQEWRMANTISTDGVSLHITEYSGSSLNVSAKRKAHEVKMANLAKGRADKRAGIEKEEKKNEEKPKSTQRAEPRQLTEMPKRGFWAIDQIKHLSRMEHSKAHIVSIDPGYHELICAVDSENTGSKAGVIRFTRKERDKQIRTVQYEVESRNGKHPTIQEGEEMLSLYNSRSANSDTFCLYCKQRRNFLQHSLEFYGRMDHRQRRWKRGIKKQQSETKLVKRLNQFKNDDRPILLAYGAWGLGAGKTNFKNLPSCIGVGLMRSLARHFPVIPTPEHYTSKTCFKCMGECGAHPTLKRNTKNGSSVDIRGLRVCQNENCKQFINRDRLGAYNIGKNFERLLNGLPPIKKFTAQERQLHTLQCSLCDQE